MAVKALSYIGVNSDKFEDWSEYSQKYLGMQQMDRGKEILSFRMDDQKQRLTITGDKGDGLGFLGWEVDSKEDLQTFANKLEENKIAVNHGKTSFADKRFVEDLIYFNDPQGNRIELVYKPVSYTHLRAHETASFVSTSHPKNPNPSPLSPVIVSLCF